MSEKNKKLSGYKVAVTRSREQAGELTAKLREHGAEVLELPLIKINASEDAQTTDDVLSSLATYEWFVFTSANGVRFFFDLVIKKFDDIRCVGPARIACIGNATAEAVRGYHLGVDLIPEESVAEKLAQALIETDSLDSANVLVITGNRNSDALPKLLESTGKALVDSLQVYATEFTDLSLDDAAKEFRRTGADFITFSSSSTVKSFIEQAGSLKLMSGAKQPKACSFGPITSKALREKGIPIEIELKEPSIDNMINAIIEKVGKI
jgi:uroporphyrinogen-III synthase